MLTLERTPENPIVVPDSREAWRAEATFNGCVAKDRNGIHILYRALSSPQYQAGVTMNVSTIGHAVSRDGFHFKDHAQFIRPEHDWERFGCEDPRVTKLGNTYYIFYTSLSSYPFSPEGITVGLARTSNFTTIRDKHHVTPFNAKAMALFPEKISGKFAALLTANTDRPPARIGLALFDEEEDLWSPDYWEHWYRNLESRILPLVRDPADQVEVGAPPLKTKAGWLVVYSYIRNYFRPPQQFGVEAALLDLRNPQKVLGRTSRPFLVPQEEYERYGKVPNIVFPSGALVRGKTFHLYYGAADTTCCLASAPLSAVLGTVKPPKRSPVLFERARENPILGPRPDHTWETRAVFNPAALRAGGKIHLLYRAMSEDNTSVLGYAASRDGVHIDERLLEPAYKPRTDSERKGQAGGNSGCEDPRLTRIGDTIYMCYTAFNGIQPPQVALSTISLQDFLAHQWVWSNPVLISPEGIEDKDACLLPAKVNGKFMVFHRIRTSIDIDFVDHLDRTKRLPLTDSRWLLPRKDKWDSEKVGIAAPPLKTSEGWLLLYHGVSSDDHYYRVGAVLLALKNPSTILARTDAPLFEPDEWYEREGQVSNVVFPCGAVIHDKLLRIYYGGADRVVGTASAELERLLKLLKTSKLK